MEQIDTAERKRKRIRVNGRRVASRLPDGQVRLIGGKRYVREDGERDVAHRGEWLVVDRNCPMGGWSNYKVFRKHNKARKKVYKISIKDGRIAGSRDAKLLKEHHPKEFMWAVARIEWNEMLRSTTNGR